MRSAGEVNRQELTLYTEAEMTSAFELAGMTVRFDPICPTGRGLYIGTAPI